MPGLTSPQLSFPIPDTSINAGFSLIEVLISILVLSFGIFGAMKMQLYSIQMSQQSNFYSTAIELASDMAERMRRNHDQLHPASSSPFLHVNFQSSEGAPEPTGLCYDTDCSSDQLANADIVEWLGNINAALPNARAVICRDSSPWNSSTGSLTWDCSADENASVVIKLGWAEQNNVEENTEINPAPRVAVAVVPYLN